MRWTGDKIKSLRDKLDETQEEFARRFRVSVDALQHWEQDRGRPSGPVEVILDRLDQDIREGIIEPKPVKQPA